MRETHGSALIHAARLRSDIEVYLPEEGPMCYAIHTHTEVPKPLNTCLKTCCGPNVLNRRLPPLSPHSQGNVLP